MADLVLSSVFQVITDKLTNFVVEKFASLWDFKDDVEKLQRTLPMVQAILEDAEEKQVNNPAVGFWLSKLKDTAYDAEVLLLQLSADSSLINRKYVDEVKNMLLALEKAADEGLHLNLTESVTVNRDWYRRETSSFVIESEVYGREIDKEKIVRLLLSSEATQGGGGTVLCIPIIGMGGLGKTTLAQLAFNDQMVTQQFDVKVWVSVAHHFDVKSILTTIIESITEAKWELSAMDAAHQKVRKLLQNKRYLLVLDNVWTEDQDDWERLRKELFGTGIDGSRILITCRSSKVEEALRKTGFPTDRYDLGELSTEACWSLFKHCAFGKEEGEEESCPDLLPIGEQIVRKCGGLALAVKTLGSVMRFKRDVKEWEFVRDSELWNLDECGSGILPALRLSYSRLPLHLKHCLAFCSIFPRSFDFNKEKLIQHWMAQGLLLQSRPRKATFSDYGGMPESTGNRYFTDLAAMSFFQEIKHYENGIVTKYRIHDIIYDLLQSVTSSEYTILGRGFAAPKSFKRIRHSSLVCDFRSPIIPEELYEAGHHLRTLLFFSEGNLEALPDRFYSSFPYLVVLNMGGSGLTELKGLIGSLSHLTYLDLSHTRIEILPPQIEDLQSLQTLNLLNCYYLLALPDFRKMKSLVHLNNEGCRKLTRMLETGGRAVRFGGDDVSYWLRLRLRLQTLPLFVVSGDSDMALLQSLRIQGCLKVTHLENIVNVSMGFHREIGIKSLGLYWGSDDGCPNKNTEGESFVSRFLERKQTESSGSSGPSQGIQHDPSKGEQVLKGLVPPHSLKTLLIKGYPGFKFPSWDVPYLNVLNLINCRQSIYLPTLGNLQFLTSLSLQEMHGVRSIGEEFYCESISRPFPVLKELALVDFPNLEKWLSPNTSGDAFPNLKKLILNNCPMLTVIPQILSLQHLETRGCSGTLLGSFQKLRSLETLIIDGVEDLCNFSGEFPIRNHLLRNLEIKSCPLLSLLPNDLENLAALKTFVIHSCGKLNFLPRSLQYLSALECLEISDCHSLTSLPDGGNRGLSSLQSFSIENCNNLNSLSMGFRHLTSLEILTIMCCPSIVALPQSVEHLHALRSLRILWCQQLTFLPEELQYLMVLHSLEISGCPSLEFLPEWIGKLVSLRSLVISDCHRITFLPEGIEILTALQHLSIQDCPQLQQRCRPETGEDWPKIAHVPYRHIELPKLKRSREEGSSSSNH